MKTADLTLKRKIAGHTFVARNFFQRLRGLIGFPPLQKGEAFWIPRCQGIHTWGMTYSIDIVFLDEAMTVVRLASEVPKNSFGPVSWKAGSVVELPAGTIKNLGIQTGDRFAFSEDDASGHSATSLDNSFTSPGSRGK